VNPPGNFEKTVYLSQPLAYKNQPVNLIRVSSPGAVEIKLAPRPERLLQH